MRNRAGTIAPTTRATAECPLFGEVARELAGFGPEALAECLDDQRRRGGRLGEALHHRGLLTRAQIGEVLREQARRAAGAFGAEAGVRFPDPAFLSLCMPAYNERENIVDTLDSACAILPQFVAKFEVVVVDDGSRDGTGRVVEDYARREPRVRLVTHPQNRGYGAAVTSGLRAAQGELVVFTDSDGQFCLLDLPRLLTLRHRYDLIIGYRKHRADPFYRRLNAWAWNVLVWAVLGVRVRDLDCAFKLLPRGVVDRLRLTATGAAINAEIMAQCVRNGLSIREVPVGHYPRHHGEPTGARLRVIARAFRELAILRKYRRSPELTWDPEPGADEVPPLDQISSLNLPPVALPK
jgi:hypothetical protein